MAKHHTARIYVHEKRTASNHLSMQLQTTIAQLSIASFGPLKAQTPLDGFVSQQIETMEFKPKWCMVNRNQSVTVPASCLHLASSISVYTGGPGAWDIQPGAVLRGHARTLSPPHSEACQYHLPNEILSSAIGHMG